ncbi:hypothetical protein GGX14DRAFT_383897 [Mycena pura]|uniref:Uncharacterized protein n=1 Tax=Mycena pura TaxID=153505 RepID=A0AAD6YUN1_9AGAR|nr:hypothetical protein GGX14DRAFT_383897 [Mycena pura]
MQSHCSLIGTVLCIQTQESPTPPPLVIKVALTPATKRQTLNSQRAAGLIPAITVLPPSSAVPESDDPEPVKRGHGRPKGSLNKKTLASAGSAMPAPSPVRARCRPTRRYIEPPAGTEMAGPLPVTGDAPTKLGPFISAQTIPPLDVDGLERVLVLDIPRPFLDGCDFCLIRDVRCDELHVYYSIRVSMSSVWLIRELIGWGHWTWRWGNSQRCEKVDYQDWSPYQPRGAPSMVINRRYTIKESIQLKGELTIGEGSCAEYHVMASGTRTHGVEIRIQANGHRITEDCFRLGVQVSSVISDQFSCFAPSCAIVSEYGVPYRILRISSATLQGFWSHLRSLIHFWDIHPSTTYSGSVERLNSLLKVIPGYSCSACLNRHFKCANTYSVFQRTKLWNRLAERFRLGNTRINELIQEVIHHGDQAAAQLELARASYRQFERSQRTLGEAMPQLRYGYGNERGVAHAAEIAPAQRDEFTEFWVAGELSLPPRPPPVPTPAGGLSRRTWAREPSSYFMELDERNAPTAPALTQPAGDSGQGPSCPRRERFFSLTPSSDSEPEEEGNVEY